MAATIAALYLLLLPPPSLAADGSLHNPPFVAGRLLVESKAGVADHEFQGVLAAHGGKSAGKLKGLNVHVVTLPPGQSERDVAARLARHPHVKFAELDELVAPDGMTNDPMGTSEWHLAKIGAPTAWDTSTGAGTIIAILDSGVDPTHPDLAAQLVPGWNTWDNNGNTADVTGHGTAVAGTAAAAANNAIGIVGVAGGARLMPVRITDTTGYASLSTIAAGIKWAADHGARVANISYAVTGSPTIQSAAQYMRSKGGVVVVSAGNDGIDTGVAPTDTMITVSATDTTDAKTSWSNYGTAIGLAAPGVHIYTTNRGGGYGYCVGTSFASPIVAGVAALIIARRPDLTAAQVASVLFGSADDLGTVGKDTFFGYGRVNAQAAVAAALTTTDTMPPSATIASPTGGTVAGSISIDVNASDNIGVTRVELKANGVLVATDTTPPYSFVWNTATLPDGSATLTAVAYDASGLAGVSAPVVVNVKNTAVDTTVPTVAITNPASGSQLGSGTVTVTATAFDAGGLSSMKLYVDGVVVATGNAGTLNYAWNTTSVAPGTHRIVVLAKDLAGNAATKQVSVTK